MIIVTATTLAKAIRIAAPHIRQHGAAVESCVFSAGVWTVTLDVQR